MIEQAVTEAFFEGAVSVQSCGSGLQPWRLPADQLDLFPSPGNSLVTRGGTTAGVRLRFATSAIVVGLRVTPEDGPRRFDLLLGCEIIETVTLPAMQQDVVFSELAAGDKVVEIWLPAKAPVIVQSVLLNHGIATPAKDDRRRWVTYGSSITHCGTAHSPARTWPATAARLRNLHLTCLGYGGNCHLEPMVAVMLGQLPADLISLKVGINIQGGSSLSPRTFMAALIGFVRILRQTHATTPIAVISPIVSPPREINPNAVGFTLPMMREEIKEAVKRLRNACGDENLHYIDGLQLFDSAWVESCLPDQLHPSGDGYELMGQRAAEHVLDLLLHR